MANRPRDVLMFGLVFVQIAALFMPWYSTSYGVITHETQGWDTERARLMLLVLSVVALFLGWTVAREYGESNQPGLWSFVLALAAIANVFQMIDFWFRPTAMDRASDAWSLVGTTQAYGIVIYAIAAVAFLILALQRTYAGFQARNSYWHSDSLLATYDDAMDRDPLDTMSDSYLQPIEQKLENERKKTLW